jgi:hypothetical protein
MKPRPSGMRRLARAAAAVALLAAGLWACGVKAPPVPPQHPPLPAVVDLAATLDGDTVTLTWNHDRTARGVAGYEVVRSAADPARPPCPGCPLVYQKAGTAAASRDTAAVTFTEQVPAGFVYTYKVRAVGSSGDRGADAGTVVVDRSAQATERP